MKICIMLMFIAAMSYPATAQIPFNFQDTLPQSDTASGRYEYAGPEWKSIGPGNYLLNDTSNSQLFFCTGLNDAFNQQRSGDRDYNNIASTLTTFQSKQSVISYTMGSRSYGNRLMLVHHSGLMPGAWAFSTAGTRTWVTEGYRDGTFSDRYSWYFALSKKIKRKSSLYFFTSGRAEHNAVAIAATKEAYELAGSNNYNPGWGYQHGESRNANISRSLLPLVALQYQYDADSSTNASLMITFQPGYNEQSVLDWYNAPDPRPDYYRKMPSYYINDPYTQNMTLAAMIARQWKNEPESRQINWDKLFDVNRTSIDPINASAGRRSSYVLGADREDLYRLSIAGSCYKTLGKSLRVLSDFNFLSQSSRNYRNMRDLLGGDYYFDFNQFAEQSYAFNNAMKQTDLDHPDSKVVTGDAYAYHYLANFIKAIFSTTVSFKRNGIDAAVSGRAGFDEYSRYGIYRNGLFPDSSQGRSNVQAFFSYQVRGSLDYKIGKHHNFRFRGLIMNTAPSFDHTFISPKTRNSVVPDVATEKIRAVEAGYTLHTSWLSGRLTIFTADVNDATEIRRFYYEGYNAFVNYVLQHIDMRHIGIDMAIQLRPVKGVTINGAVLWKQVFFNADPEGSLYRDDDTSTQVGKHTAYLKNYYASYSPQSVYNLNVQYYSARRKFRAGIYLKRTNRNYVRLNPMRHTSEAIEMLPKGSDLYQAVLQQEELPAAFTVDVSAGKSFYLKRLIRHLPGNPQLNISCGVNNLFNNKNIIVTAGEQLRFDYDSRDPQRFPTKYTYGQGANWFVRCRLEW